MSTDREAVLAAFDTIDAAMGDLVGYEGDDLATREQLAMLERCEKVRRQLPAIEHPLINNLARQATAEELGGKLSHAIAESTLISRAEASRRIKEASDLGPRRGLTGEPIPPILPATAAAQREGKLGAGQVAVIRRFFHQLPGWVDSATRQAVEADLATHGMNYRPEQLAELADHVADCLNPDGTYTDDDRARRRGLTLSKQQADGMSELRGLLTPEARATVEAVLASWPRRACATRWTTRPAWTARPARMRSTVTADPRPNATTTRYWRRTVRCWRRESWVSTTACRPPSSSPRRCRSWKPPPGVA